MRGDVPARKPRVWRPRTGDRPLAPRGSVPPPGPDFLALARASAAPVADEPRGGDPDKAAKLEAAVAKEESVRAGAAALRAKSAPLLKIERIEVKLAAAEAATAKAAAAWEKSVEAEVEVAREANVLDAVDALYREALYGGVFTLPVAVRTAVVSARLVPGHSLDPCDPVPGPRPVAVMVVGKHPGEQDVVAGEHFTDTTGGVFAGLVAGQGLEAEARGWYVTALTRHARVDPAADAIPAAHVKNCAPLLFHELAVCRPDFVLCLGPDPAKALLGVKGITVGGSRGEVYDLPVPAANGFPEKTAKLIVMPNPAAVVYDPLALDDVADGFAEFVRVYRGAPPPPPAPPRRHVVLYNEDRLAAVVDEVVARPDGDVVALDCEWHGDWWDDAGYLLSIQFSTRPGEAFVVRLRSEGGAPAFRPNEEAAFVQIRRLCAATPGRVPRVGGHFFRADLPWLLEKAGIDLRDRFAPPATAAETATAGGFDTAYMVHSVFEEGRPYAGGGKDMTLESWAAKLLGTPRYDAPLEAFLAEYRRERKLKKEDLGGYGVVPDDVLDPYAAWDVDATRSLFDVFNGVDGEPGLLDADRYGLNSREAYRTSMAAQSAFLEMEMTGMLVDRERVDALSCAFLGAAERELRELREHVGWESRVDPVTGAVLPGFNPASGPQVRELLFGEGHSGAAVDPATGGPRRLRPEGVETLGLTPVKTTGKRGRAWTKVVEEDADALYKPAADSESLGILGIECEVADRIRRTRFLQKMTSNPLNPPLLGPDGRPIEDADGRFSYSGGFMKHLAGDGRVRTRFYPVETGRCSSSKPNLQNWSSRREGDYARLLGEAYLYPLRTCFHAPEGSVIVKTDLKSAELVAVARQSGDANMIADVARAVLPEDHPDFADMHAARAVAAFKLDCPPTKDGLKAIGKSALRTASKNQLYGTLYGRGIAALVRQCLEEHVRITFEEMTAIHAAFLARYPDVAAYLEEAGARASVPGWATSALGRHRRFAWADNPEVRASAGRSFKNFPIQGLVADVIALWMERLWAARAAHRAAGGPHDFAFMLQLHDELDFLAPAESAGWLAALLKETLAGIEVPVRDLGGARVPGAEPFHFDADVSVYEHWGEALTAADAERLGLDPAFAGGDD